MPLQRESFRVYLNPLDDAADPTEHVAVITHQDMLRGEQAHLDGGASMKSALGLTTAWCWASLMRQGDYAGPYQRFRDLDCAGLEGDDPKNVDPTQPGTPDDSP